MARDFGKHAGALASAADAHDLEGAADALGRIAGDCAGCHEELRWTRGSGNRP
jgi:hypothetical protein